MEKVKLLLIGLLLGSQVMPSFGQIGTLTDYEKSDLLYMLEEEKLAMDVYDILGEKWGIRIFDNIKSSEKRHVAAVKEMAEKNELTIPSTVSTLERGVFKNKDLQSLYEELVSTGSQSLVSALTVGAKIEELDIKDLDAAIANTSSEDLIGMYISLRSASKNHLRAFVRNLDKRGVQYMPNILSGDDYAKIIEGENAKGKSHADKYGKEGHKDSCKGKGNKNSAKNKGKNGKSCC